jgi:hypothetical protein
MSQQALIEICQRCGEHHPRCTGHKKAKNSPDGKLHPCMQYPMKASSTRKCRMCGGATPSGAASPHYKTGRYSKVLPGAIRKKYEEAARDEELVTLSAEIALLDAQMQERLEKVYSGESRDFWNHCRSLFGALNSAINKPDSKDRELQEAKEAEVVNFLELLGAALDEGDRRFNAYEAVKAMFEQRRKLVETENKRLKDLDQTITNTQAMMLVTMVIDCVNRVVKAADERRALSSELALLLNK